MALFSGNKALPTELKGSTTSAKEMKTISSFADGLTSATYGMNTKAIIQVQDAPVRYWTSGDDPTSTEGVLAQIGDVISLDTNADIANFKAIRTTSTDAKLAVQYYA